MRLRSKFHNIRTPCGNGHVHDSKLEAGECNYLCLLQKGGHIADLEFQVTIKIDTARGARFVYRPDFAYLKNGLRIYHDSKGAITPKMKSIMHAWPKFGPVGATLLVSGGAWREEIKGPAQARDIPMKELYRQILLHAVPVVKNSRGDYVYEIPVLPEKPTKKGRKP